MDPQVGRAGFRIAFYVILVSGVLLLFLPRQSAEFVVAAMALGMGLIFAAAIGILGYVAARQRQPSPLPPPLQEDHDEGG